MTVKLLKKPSRSVSGGMQPCIYPRTSSMGLSSPTSRVSSPFTRYYEEISQQRAQRASTSQDVRHRSTGSDPRSLSCGSPETTTHSLNSPMECTMEYLADLVKEKKQLDIFPHGLTHVERLVDEEITRVRLALFQCDFVSDDLALPEPIGDVVTVTEKLYVPRKEHPDYNFVGRILGPRGMTAKQLEQETGCKIMVRGRGSMRDRRKEEQNRGKPNWEHLEDELHVLIQCEDTPNRAAVKMRIAVEHVKKLLVPAPEGTDELKRKQLMELAIINGTYRPYHRSSSSHPDAHRLLAPVPLLSPLRPNLFLSPTSSPTPANSSMIHPTLPAMSPPAPTFDFNAMMNQSFMDSLLSSLNLAGHSHTELLSAAAAAAASSPVFSSSASSLMQSLPGSFFPDMNNPSVAGAYGNIGAGLLGSASPQCSAQSVHSLF